MSEIVSARDRYRKMKAVLKRPLGKSYAGEHGRLFLPKPRLVLKDNIGADQH
jgi:hypothetical protein